MKPIICVLVLGTIVAVHSAPALLTQQYLLITPEAQLQLAPALKLHQPILQPITQVKKYGSLKDGENKEILLYYPNTPLVQYPTVLPLRRQFFSWGDFLAEVQDLWPVNDKPESKPMEGDDPKGDSPKIERPSEKLEFENDAEVISQSPAAPAPVPAPIPNYPAIPTLNGHRFYVLGGEPQFYGNFAGLNDPSNPLYAFQPILTKGRAVDSDNEAVSDESVEISAAPSSDVGVKTLPEKILVQSEARFQSKYPAALNEDELNTAAKLEGKEENFQKASENESKSSEEQNLKVSDDPSVARASPEGIALAGKGGLAASYPFGTALVGKGGVAFAAPSATSISGDFLDIGKA